MRDYIEGMALGFLIGVIFCALMFYVLALVLGGGN